jgi:transcriptional regulator with XRE-family HTH domain
MAERAGIAVNTLTRIEQGSGGVSMAAWAQALFVLGFTEKLRNLADLSTDKTGLLLEDESLPKRVRYPKRREG